MAIIHCVGCGQPVSEQAGACPHCGRPVEAAEAIPGTPAGRAQMWAITGCIVTAVVALFAGAILVFDWPEVVTIVRRLVGK